MKVLENERSILFYINYRSLSPSFVHYISLRLAFSGSSLVSFGSLALPYHSLSNKEEIQVTFLLMSR